MCVCVDGKMDQSASIAVITQLHINSCKIILTSIVLALFYTIVTASVREELNVIRHIAKRSKLNIKNFNSLLVNY